MAQVKGSEDLRNFVSQVIRAQGVPALQERPRVMVGTVHSLKGHEADIVVLCPDISPEGYTAARKDTQVAEELKRLFYVGLTRAKLGLYLCAPDSRTAVRW
jgi:superfamily I DNA/RNA helicase